MEIKAIDFSYSSEIKVVSEKQFEVHKKLYEGYVSKTNEICEALKNERSKTGNATYSEYRGLKKGQSYAIDGVILHELYFKNIGGIGSKAAVPLKKGIISAFGSYEKWVQDFRACAMSARGWAILAYEQRTKSLINVLLDTHDDGIIMGAFPILIIDMYEHAYFIDYASNKGEYFERFMDNVNWNVVNRRFGSIMCD